MTRIMGFLFINGFRQEDGVREITGLRTQTNSLRYKEASVVGGRPSGKRRDAERAATRPETPKQKPPTDRFKRRRNAYFYAICTYFRDYTL